MKWLNRVKMPKKVLIVAVTVLILSLLLMLIVLLYVGGSPVGNAFFISEVAIVLAIIVISVFLFFIYFNKHIVKELELLLFFMNELAEGRVILDYVDTVNEKDSRDREDEIGALSNSLKKLANSYTEQVKLVKGVAEGDLTPVVTIRSEKDVVHKVFSNLFGNLNKLLTSIIKSSETVSDTARSVSSSSFELSQGATEQASAVQQLTASLEQIAGQTEKNASNAQSANMLTKSAAEKASEGNRQMTDMLGAMEEINQSSSSIGRIIKVIDDIAFQTNILALNAAVEAARAGQHGKGFAVVAEEVRTLAAKSANAAKETTDLIEGSIRRAEAGTRIANSTAESLRQIVEQVRNAASLNNEIALASREQAVGISQINDGIQQVSKIVQKNAAAAEESAAASEGLAAEADKLRADVSVFKINRNVYPADDRRQAMTKKPAKALPELLKAEVVLAGSDFGKY